MFVGLLLHDIWRVIFTNVATLAMTTNHRERDGNLHIFALGWKIIYVTTCRNHWVWVGAKKNQIEG